MTLKEYAKQNPNCDLRTVKVRIPDDFHEEAKLSGLKKFEVFLISRWFMGVWVKLKLEDERVYPITGVVDISDWEIVN